MRLLSFVSASVLALCLSAAPAQSAEFNGTQKTEIEQIVKDYLLKNPDVIRDVFVLLRKQDEEREQQAQLERLKLAKVALEQNKEEIFNAKDQVVIGNPKGDVTLVEFLDYNCGYCKRAFTNMLKLMDSDKNLRVVLKEWPVLGPQSMEAALVATSVQRLAPEKYWDFHKGMMTLRGTASKESALRVAEKLGMDRKKLEAMFDEKASVKPIEDAYRLAEALQLTGTPGYVVGDEVIPGFVPVNVLQEKIKDVRTCGKTSC